MNYKYICVPVQSIIEVDNQKKHYKLMGWTFFKMYDGEIYYLLIFKQKI